MIQEVFRVRFREGKEDGAMQKLADKAKGLGFKEFKRGDLGLWVPQDQKPRELPLHFLAAYGLVIFSHTYSLMEHKIELPITIPHQLVDAAKSLNTLHYLTGGGLRAFGGWQPFGENKNFLRVFPGVR